MKQFGFNLQITGFKLFLTTSPEGIVLSLDHPKQLISCFHFKQKSDMKGSSDRVFCFTAICILFEETNGRIWWRPILEVAAMMTISISGGNIHLSKSYSVPGSEPSAFFIYNIWLIFIILLWSRHFIPILWMRNFRIKDFKYLHQGLTAGKWHTQDFSLRLRALPFEFKDLSVHGVRWCVILFGHGHIQQTFTECLLCAGHCSKHLGRWSQISYLGW